MDNKHSGGSGKVTFDVDFDNPADFAIELAKTVFSIEQDEDSKMILLLGMASGLGVACSFIGKKCDRMSVKEMRVFLGTASLLMKFGIDAAVKEG